MNRFTLCDTTLSGLTVITRKPIGDGRGYLERLFCAHELATIGWEKPIAQVNRTLTQKRGAVRGMHFQKSPHAEMKLVSCLRGVVWDVAVDLRAGSPTFLQWHAEELSADNHRALVIPEGFAHGFQAMTDDCEMLYFHSSAYSAGSEGAVNAIDPKLGICWPQAITEWSARDRAHVMLADNFQGLIL